MINERAPSPFFYARKSRSSRTVRGPAEARKDLRPGFVRAALVPALGGRGAVPAGRPGELSQIRNGHSAAQRDRTAPHRTRPGAHARGRHRALEADAGLSRSLGPGHGPRGHCHAVGDRAPARERRHGPQGPRAGGLRRARVGLEAGSQGHHPDPDEAPRLLARLDARAVHARPGSLARGAARVRPALERGADLPRPLCRQLVPALRHRRLGSGGRAPRSGRQALQDPLRRAGRRLRSGRRDDTAGDDAWRHSPRHPPGRSADGGAAGPEGDPADRRAGDPDHRGPDSRGPRVRHGDREGHAGARRQRLRNGGAAQAPGGRRHRPRRQDDSGGRRGLRGARPVQGAQGRARAARIRGPSREHGGPPPRPRPLPALRYGHRAVPFDPVVREDPAPGRARHPGGRGRDDPDGAGVVGKDLLRLDAQHP